MRRVFVYLIAFFCLIFVSQSFAQDSRPNAFGQLDPSTPMGIGGRSPLGLGSIYSLEEKVKGTDQGFSSFRQDARITFPLYREGAHFLMANLSLRYVGFQTDAVLPTTGSPFPNQLWNIGTGVTYIHNLGDGWTMGGGVSLTSPSDQPYDSIQEINPMLTAFLRRPAANERDAWLFSLAYMPASLIRFPLPGVAYEWNPSEDFRMSIGIPFSIYWRPFETFRWDLAYMPPRSIRTQLTWEPIEGIGFYTGFEWINDVYFLADRTDKQERFFAFEKRVPLGVRITRFDKCTIDVGGGYAFGRMFFSGRQFQDRDKDLVEIEPGPYLQLRVAVAF